MAAAGHGGARKGAGRKSGGEWVSKRHPQLRVLARERAADLVAQGRDPLLVLVDFAFDETLDVTVRMQAATAAAPYLHPRLSALAVQSTSTTVKVDATDLVARLSERIARLAQRPPVVEHAPAPAEAAA